MSKQQPLSPSTVNNYIKKLLEGDLQLKKLYIEGEASNVKYHANGNIYFNIKDDQAQINCIMFKNYVQNNKDKIVDGDKIEILGNIYAYVKMGQVSINVFKLRKMGQGDLYAKYLELKSKLEKEGLFSKTNKKDIVDFPERIGVITSDTGAAIRDIITTIKRRYPMCKVYVFPTLVQGEKAHFDIVENINLAQTYNLDTLIVGRGGGSIEDLWAFNLEDVAHAIYNCTVPIISAVGHETDFTIADFVADMRAPTPTAAAEIATPDQNTLINDLNQKVSILSSKLNGMLSSYKERLHNLKNSQYFTNPILNVQTNFSYLQLEFLNEVKSFNTNINNKIKNLDQMKNLNIDTINQRLKNYSQNLENKKEYLDSLNPLTLLSKGYSIVLKDDKIVKSVKQIDKNSSVNIKLSDGEAKANVISIKEKDKNE